jgi:tetratricopeptide (TPR) repeat protein
MTITDQSHTPPKLPEKLLDAYHQHKIAYQANPTDADKLIWYARFTAYKGEYQEAIELYTQGIEQFPADARFLRHRGQRYITIREFGLAIQDFERAAKLIQNTPDQIELDGIPNARNVPVSTLHSNIWYHLGLARYLQNDLNGALQAYQRCLISNQNNDNLVAATHWLYMILRRLGRRTEAENYLVPIHPQLEVIENTDYFRLCLFYLGELELAQLLDEATNNPGGRDGISYAVGNWHFYHGEEAKARQCFHETLKTGRWDSFGYIAAEAHLFHHFQLANSA